jgi:thiosulfate dehydrogenase
MRMGVPGDALGYRYPPLWGPGASNDGAGMARLTTVARFAHNDMPASAEAQPPRLRPEEAWDIAAHIVSKPRPAMAGLEKDYPDLLEKPVDTPYGPYADGFDREAHLFGPYGPIQARIAELKAAR